MRNSLSVANEDSLRKFPLESSCARLIDLVKQEPIMDISNDIKCKYNSLAHQILVR